MLDINKARIAFKKFLDFYDNKSDLGFNLKVIHTHNVVNNAKNIVTKLKLSEEDKKLAELIGLLHDIGRFEELKILKKFDSVNFDHANHGVKILFEENLIRDFIEDNKYDEIIKIAIYNHNKLNIQNVRNDRSLIHAKIIRDADKLDNFRVKKEERIEEIFPKIVNNKSDIENSLLSDKVYDAIKNKKCVNIHDRVTPLDYWVCVLAFIFDLNFKESCQIVKDENYINILIDRFLYNDDETKNKMENIRKILSDYIEERIKSR